ncbi:hypothetical protein AB0B39_21215 [Micromonospora sp. NPDC049114]|uniref:hypothetical protein n=1 Tax=Micromonospora sp. NPDC049114 TaxID=3155498 RepID=UPI0033C439F2
MPELLEQLGEMGLVGLVKIDGERERKPWTVVISGERLAGAAIRVDGHSLEYCLRHVVAALHVPGLDWRGSRKPRPRDQADPPASVPPCVGCGQRR